MSARPQVGSTYERDGIGRTVLAVDEERVRYSVRLGQRVELHAVSVAQWGRWARRAQVVASGSSCASPAGTDEAREQGIGGAPLMADSSSTHPPPPLSERDARVLRALMVLPAKAPRARRLEAAGGLSWPAWRRAMERLLALTLVVRVEGERSSGEPDEIRLTDLGRTCAARHTPAQGPGTPPGTPLGSCSSSQPLEEEEKEPTKNQGGMPLPVPGGTPPAQGPAHPPVPMGEGVTVSTTTVHHEHRVSLSDEDRALMRAFIGAVEASRGAFKPATSSVVNDSSTTSGAAPKCDCGLPMVEKTRRADGQPFIACPRGKKDQGGCGKTLGIGHDEPTEQPATSKAAEEAKAERERHRKQAEADRKAAEQAQVAEVRDHLAWVKAEQKKRRA